MRCVGYQHLTKMTDDDVLSSDAAFVIAFVIAFVTSTAQLCMLQANYQADTVQKLEADLAKAKKRSLGAKRQVEESYTEVIFCLPNTLGEGQTQRSLRIRVVGPSFIDCALAPHQEARDIAHSHTVLRGRRRQV